LFFYRSIHLYIFLKPVPPPQQPSAAAYLPSPQPPAYQPSAYIPVPTPEPAKQPVVTRVDLTDYEQRQSELEAREKRLAEREQALKGEGLLGSKLKIKFDLFTL
jgi:hypothetical protein